MSHTESSNRECLLRAYMYAFGHIYGVLPFDMAAEAFNHYEDRHADEKEIIAALQISDRQSVAPHFDLRRGEVLSPILRTFSNARDVIDAIEEKRRRCGIFYPDRNEVQSYCEFTPWSPVNAWDAFAENGAVRHYLKGSSDYVFFLWQYFIEIQTEWSITHSDMLSQACCILPEDASKWFMERVAVADDDERECVLSMAKRMFYTTRLWTQFGRCALDVIRENAGDPNEKLDDFCKRMTTDCDYCVAQEPQKLGSFKVERNAPCPCGSGLKYKKCCGRTK